jgi:hypothetical protein
VSVNVMRLLSCAILLSAWLSSMSPALAEWSEPAGQRAVLYEENPNNPAGEMFTGAVVWRVEQAASASGQKPDLVVHADIDIPHKLSMRWSLQRNGDKGLRVGEGGRDGARRCSQRRVHPGL